MRSFILIAVALGTLSCASNAPKGQNSPQSNLDQDATQNGIAAPETSPNAQPSSKKASPSKQKPKTSSGPFGASSLPTDTGSTTLATSKSPKKPSKTKGVVKSGSALSGKEATAMLSYHNKVRRTVKTKPLSWDISLAKYAQAWANHLQKRCRMIHRKKSPHGENLWMGTARAYTVVDAAKSWESEKKYYNGGKLSPSNWYKSGHYTQMVWKNTKRLGCGKSICNGQMIVVCNYNPPGNFMGQNAY